MDDAVSLVMLISMPVVADGSLTPPVPEVTKLLSAVSAVAPDWLEPAAATDAVENTTFPDEVMVVAVMVPTVMFGVPVRPPEVPVVFWFKVGKVQLVNVPDEGVPRIGAVNVGEVRVLLVNVCVAARVTTVSDVPGNVIVVASVPANVNEFDTVSVLPAVTDRPVTLPAEPVVFWFSVGKEQFAKLPEDGVPRMGVTNVGDVARATTVPLPEVV